MKAFVVKFEELLKLNTGSQGEVENFCVSKRKLLIPLYQREYTWTDEKIVTLIKDIERCNKYLGNIILDESETCYEIVDGQQRITTCFLILACLYNKYNGRQREQEALMRLIKPYGEFVLKNDSVGDYISELNDRLSITIDPANDVYYQANDFKRAFETITEVIEKFEDHERIIEFKRKLLACKILVLINDQHDNTQPVEQLFLDNNEKAQLLQVEDIFKGHCFENCEEYFYQDLRSLWIQFKKCTMGFKKFGYEDASEYIYLYLLETEGNFIPKNLTIAGKHYLDGKDMDETEGILREMIAYGENNLKFYDNLFKTDYRFVDLCQNSHEYRFTDDHLVLKQMCKKMLESKAAKYQKLPLLYFVHSMCRNEERASLITHEQFRKIITNFYIYTMLFIMGGSKKSKNDIDYTIKHAIDGEDAISQVVVAAKEIRTQKVDKFLLQENFGFDKLSFVYSVVDAYNPNRNWLKEIYSSENGYTLEHFVIPDNRGRRICWKDGDNTFEFQVPIEDVRLYKKTSINYLIIKRTLNEFLEHNDIVSKVQAIRLWYEQRNENLPKHVSVIFEYIVQMPEYIELMNLKGGNYSQDVIELKYIEFIRKYFDPENRMREELQKKFVDSFQNS